MQVVCSIDPTAKHVDTFEAIAAASEVFSEEVCGKCGGTTHYFVREVDGDKYYEKRCDDQKDCKAKKPFSCHKKGGSMYFSKKKKGTDEYWPDNGWRRWNSETQQEE